MSSTEDSEGRMMAVDTFYEKTGELMVKHSDYELLFSENKSMRAALDDLVMLIAESTGVDGWHLNGDLAEWNELLEGEALANYHAFVSGRNEEPTGE